MKKIILLLIAFLPFITNATNYTSVSGGGNWSNSATWSPTGVPGSGDNVTIASNVTLNANESCNNITINSGYTFSGSSNTLSVYGNFTNNGTFTYSTGTVSFVGSSAQTIGGGSSGITFYNLTVNSTSTTTLAQVITVNNNLDIAAGTLDCEQYQITGNATGTITVGAGATLILGSTSSSTNVTVPTNYTVAHASVSSTSTIVYQANTNSQSIASAFTYGNLTVSGGSITVVKAPGGTSAITVSGNLLVNVVEFNMTTKNLNVTGNVTNDGAISFSTGAFNIGGNFTNSGTYTYGTGTLTFDGSANQQLNGTTTPGLYNLTINQNSTTDSVFFNAPITVSNTLTSTKGVLDCKKHQLTNSSTPALTVSPSSPSICYGSSTTLSTSGYSTYIWAPSSSLSASTGSSVTATPLVTTTYTVYGSTSSVYTCALGTDVGTVKFCNNSCSNAVDISSDGCIDNVPVIYGKMWFSFTASGNIGDITIHNYPDANPGRITKAYLYSGTCSLLDSIGFGQLTPDPGTADSILFITDASLTSGNTYYVKLISDDSTSGRTFNICLHRATSTCPSTPSCNLVSNGNFESYNTCPLYNSGILSNYCNCWGATTNGGSPDYFNSCDTNTPPQFYAGVPENCVNSDENITPAYVGYTDNHTTGNNTGGYAGLIAWIGSSTPFREYIQQTLPTAMSLNTAYKVSFWVQLTPYAEYYVDPTSLGMFITNTSNAPTTATSTSYQLLDWLHNPINSTSYPTQLITAATSGTNITVPGNWVEISGTYTASGGENLITIGNFNDNSSTVAYYTGGLNEYCAYYFIDDVSITKSLLASASPQTICADSGTGTTLSATSGFTTYTWTPGSLSGQSVSVTPQTTTTYTVIATDGTCTDTSTVIVYVTNCCSPSCSANAHGTSGTKNWSTGLYIKSGTVSNTIDGSTVTISGCTRSSSNTGVAITGPFTINGTCTFRDVNVAMSAYSQINVPNGSTLIIDSSRFYSCDTMWQGIYVEPGGTLIVDSNSIIEDAQIAIEGHSAGTSASITVENSLLNNNFYDMQIDPYFLPAQYPLTLRNVTFTTSSDPFSPNAYLKGPYIAGILTNTGVFLDSVLGTVFGKETITIGNDSNSAYLCNFSNMKFGVNAYNSNFAVFNNNFSNLEGRTTPSFGGSPYGIAVYANATAYDTTNSNTFCAAIVGSSGTNYPNTIENCFRGVDVTKYFRLQVDSNYFYTSNDNINGNGVIPYGDHAVYYKTEGHDSIQFLLSHNIIENFNTGIHVAGLLPTEIGSLATNNLSSFINTNYIHANSTNVLGTGILAENLFNNYPGLHSGGLYIQNNTIDSADVCIELNELSDYLYTYVNINPELYVLPSVSTDNTFKAGIYMTDCSSSLYVSDNPEIIATGTYINSTAAAADSDVVGINAYITEGQICGNTLYNLGQGIKFTGDCQNTAVYNNSVDNMYDGFVLDMVGVIGQQGSSGYPIGDVWGAVADFAHTNGQTYTYSSVPTNSILYLATLPTANGTNDLFGTYNYISGTSLYGTTGTAPTCTSPSVKDPSPLHRALSTTVIDTAAIVRQMKQAIYDSVPLTGFVSESQFMMQQTIYNTLSNSPALLAKDTALQNFYNRNQSRSIGIIYNMTHSIQNGNYTGAKTINNAFVPKTTIEQNYKDVNNIMLSTYGSGIDSATSSQIATLQNIASQCPLSGGRAVFQARALLNTLLNTNVQYYNDCTGEAGHIAIKKNQPIMSNAHVYPNPANSQLNIEVNLNAGETGSFCLYNEVGQRVECLDITNGTSTMSTANLAPGVYFYRITGMNGNLIKSDKIMIVH